MDGDGWQLSRPVRCVTARQLARNTSQILDEIRREAHTLMVIRRGQPMALLGPTPDNIFPVGAPSPPKEEVREEELAELDLDELQRHILVAMSRESIARVREFTDASHGEFALALFGLEVKRLVAKRFAGHELTREGLRVAQALEALP